jgi:hypothetical protein
MWQQDAYRMIQRRAADAGIKTRIGNHTFRATGITAYLKNKGALEAAQHIANHESPARRSFMIGELMRFHLIRWRRFRSRGSLQKTKYKQAKLPSSFKNFMSVSGPQPIFGWTG